MSISRRTMLMMAGGAVCATGALAALNGGLRDWLMSEIAQNFGDDIAARAETAEFLDDFIATRFDTAHPGEPLNRAVIETKRRLVGDIRELWRERQVSDALIHDFIRSTSVLRHRETGAPFLYAGLGTPYEIPCSNMLSAYALEIA